MRPKHLAAALVGLRSLTTRLRGEGRTCCFLITNHGDKPSGLADAESMIELIRELDDKHISFYGKCPVAGILQQTDYITV